MVEDDKKNLEQKLWAIDNDLTLVGIPGKLNVHKNHVIDKDYLNYHIKLAYKKNI